jgi:hypothetical protein
VRLLVVAGAAVAAALVVGASPAGATRECDGLQVCVPRAGPWVVVPTSASVPRQKVEYQLACPKRYVVGGLDAELSNRAIDVSFLGSLGSPVNPGISTSTSVVFVGSYVGRGASAASFRPHIGCLPAKGGGSRVPTATGGPIVAGHPTIRRARTVRVQPGSSSVSESCSAHERLVGGAQAFGFYMRRPPSASLIGSLSGTLNLSGRRAKVQIRADAEISSVRAVVQVQAICARTT